LRNTRQEPVVICSLTGRFPHPEMAGGTTRPGAILASANGNVNRPLSSRASGLGRLLERPAGCARFRPRSAAGPIALGRTGFRALAPSPWPIR